jgi:nucleotide-binding universal stress UspA family protein
VTLLLAHGDPAEAIVEEAKSRKADVVVIGRRPLGSVHRFFVGSSSGYVVEHCDANVMVVHSKEEEKKE